MGETQRSADQVDPRLPTQDLLGWYERVRRDLPWRRTRDPYAIWVSEIMLQQTRVEAVIPYYERWMRAFPTIADLAGADRMQVLKLWEGLGYYSRARNLHDTAMLIQTHYKGVFPDNYRDILSLKGIGAYTAAAIASIAFGQDAAAVDGNVIRVLSRWYGIQEDVRRPSTQATIQSLASGNLPHGRASEYNQALMELGATCCTPKRPSCGECPMGAGCQAHRLAMTDALPFKSRKAAIPHHQVVVGIARDAQGRVLIALRPEEAMLGGLWEFPGGKQEKDEHLEQTLRREFKEELGVEILDVEWFHSLDHAYSHFKITLTAFLCTLAPDQTPTAGASKRLEWVDIGQLGRYPFPKANKVLVERLMQSIVKDGAL